MPHPAHSAEVRRRVPDPDTASSGVAGPPMTVEGEAGEGVATGAGTGSAPPKARAMLQGWGGSSAGSLLGITFAGGYPQEHGPHRGGRTRWGPR